MAASSLPNLIVERLKSAIYADISNSHQLSVGLIGGDIPVFPPLAVLLTTIVALVAWANSGKRYRFLPSFLQSLPIRILLAAVGIRAGLSVVNAVEEELQRMGTTPNFAAVSKIASQGPFAWTRNGMYLSVFLMQFSIAIGLDTTWLLASLFTIMIYLDRVVVPAEEAFLTREIGTEYQQYCEAVPRWLF